MQTTLKLIETPNAIQIKHFLIHLNQKKNGLDGGSL